MRPEAGNPGQIGFWLHLNGRHCLLRKAVCAQGSEAAAHRRLSPAARPGTSAVIAAGEGGRQRCPGNALLAVSHNHTSGLCLWFGQCPRWQGPQSLWFAFFGREAPQHPLARQGLLLGLGWGLSQQGQGRLRSDGGHRSPTQRERSGRVLGGCPIRPHSAGEGGEAQEKGGLSRSRDFRPVPFTFGRTLSWDYIVASKEPCVGCRLRPAAPAGDCSTSCKVWGPASQRPGFRGPCPDRLLF